MPTRKKTRKKKKLGKLDTYRQDLERKGPFEKALTPLNIFLFVVAALIMALAIIEPSRVLDFVAAIGFLLVMGKIILDGYR